MDEVLILENLNNLDEAKRLVCVLEIRNLDDDELFQKIGRAKKCLDRALINFAFDLRRKIEGSEDSNKLIISDDIATALEFLQDINDNSLSKRLSGLVEFFKAYEENSYESKLDDDRLSSKIEMIIAERFC